MQKKSKNQLLTVKTLGIDDFLFMRKQIERLARGHKYIS